MAIIDPPAPFPLRNAKWRVPFPAQVNKSGWTGTSQAVGLPGAQLWSLSGTFVPTRSEASALPWIGFFMSLRGQLNFFRVRACEVQQTSASNPTARTGANDGITLPLQGLPVSATILKIGHKMTVVLPSGHERLVVLSSPLVSDSSGHATAVFEPELGEVPVAGAAVEIQWPYGLMRMTSDPPGWDVDVGQMFDFRRVEHGFSRHAAAQDAQAADFPAAFDDDRL